MVKRLVRDLVGDLHRPVIEENLRKLVCLRDIEVLSYKNKENHKAFRLENLLGYFLHIKEISF